MNITRDVVHEKVRVAHDLMMIKCYLLTPELSAKLFAQKGIGVFRFSAALIEWSQGKLEGLQKIWVKVYKNAWHITMVNSKLTMYLPNCRGLPLVPHAVRSTHAGLAAAR